MNPIETSQPLPDGQSLGLFARARVGLATGSDAATFRQYAERLAALADSDLVLIYEGDGESDELRLLAQWGLPPEAEAKFGVLGDERSQGAGGLRAELDDPQPLAYAPLTPDLLELGIRGYWAYPLWSDGVLKGQLFFGSRRWDQFHDDTLAVFAATTLQVGHALERRNASAEGAQPSWVDDGTRGAASKRRQFIAVLAHELRNPIAPIRSGLDLLWTGKLDEEGRRVTLDTMQRQVAHLVRLIDDLLDTVRLDTGRLQVRRETVMLKDVVRSAIESIRPALAAKHQALRLDDVAAEVVVDVDPVRLAQAFVNILSANVSQTPEGGVISVTVEAEAPDLVITFEDEGAGIPTGEESNVFQLFPDSAAQKSEGGWGIGLALVKGLVELNDGSVDLKNREAGKGARYTVRLPKANAELKVFAKADGDTPEWPSHRVLIVDDNRDAADTLGLLFELDGHTVRIANDGLTAVSEALEFQPEVVLMDIGLPGINGNEATRRIRAHPARVRPFIIALTGWGTATDKEATRSAGCDMHLVKPVSHDELRQRILELTAHPTEGQQNV